MNIFLDANILVSVLNKEYPLFPFTSRILSNADKGKLNYFTSPVALAITFYFATKKSGQLKAKEKINVLCRHIAVADNSGGAVEKALNNPSVEDFEDGLQYYAALEQNCTCIVTEDRGDYYFSDIEIMRSKDFCEKYIFTRKYYGK